ncbi:hypothetical protein V4890_24100 [Ralstonia solanacearum species complex bacterium KE056]|uniref:hypothetical protein n=1 Tax=Ralstonia solanacearum species complex bacterium KE056 TaxID=3119585 RepID=UPI002FC39919
MRKVTVLLCCAFLFGCNFGESEIEPNQFDSDFFRLSTDTQVKRFHEYDLQIQYELVIVGNQVVHPPAIYLAEEFAEQGAAAIPFLRDKLASAKKEATVRDIVAILAEMHRLKSYNVGNDSALMRLVDERVNSMQGQWKSVTLHMLQEIRGNS